MEEVRRKMLNKNENQKRKRQDSEVNPAFFCIFAARKILSMGEIYVRPAGFRRLWISGGYKPCCTPFSLHVRAWRNGLFFVKKSYHCKKSRIFAMAK